MKIVSPSYKRAGKTKTDKVFGRRLIFAVHEFEAAEYEKAYQGNKLLIIPDYLKGNMAKVRNYIIENIKDNKIVMVDDDVSVIGYYENSKKNKLDYNRIISFLNNGFVMAEELGTPLWGINLQTARNMYRENTPFSMLSPVLGTFTCLNTDGLNLRYDERLGLNEDYDFALQVLQRYHKILRFNKYHYFADHITMKGGCGEYRLMKEEKRQAEIMIKKWGEKVVRYDFKRSANPQLSIPYKGV